MFNVKWIIEYMCLIFRLLNETINLFAVRYLDYDD